MNNVTKTMLMVSLLFSLSVYADDVAVSAPAEATTSTVGTVTNAVTGTVDAGTEAITGTVDAGTKLTRSLLSKVVECLKETDGNHTRKVWFGLGVASASTVLGLIAVVRKKCKKEVAKLI